MKKPKFNTIYFAPINVDKLLNGHERGFLHIDYRRLMAGGEIMDRTDAAVTAQNDRQMFNYIEAYNWSCVSNVKHRILELFQEFFKHPKKSPDYDFVVHGWNAMTVSIPQQILVLQQLYLIIRITEPLSSEQRNKFNHLASILDEYFGEQWSHPETQAIICFAKIATLYEPTGNIAVDTCLAETYNYYRTNYTSTLAEALLVQTDLFFN